MPGIYKVELLGPMLDKPLHNIRQALSDAKIDIDANDSVDADKFLAKEKDVRKYLDDQEKERLDAKQKQAGWADEKAKAVAAHNKKVGAAAPEPEES